MPTVDGMFKYHGISLLLAGCTLVADLPAARAATGLDLASALAMAPQANFQILLTQEAVTSQQEAARIARSALLPQVYLDAAQSRSMTPTALLFTGSTQGLPSRAYIDRFDAVLRARLSLLSTRSIDDWRLARMSVRATEWQLQDTIQSILEQIAVRYFTHWRNQRRLAVLDANLERDRVLLKIAREQEAAGVATPLDVTRAEVRLANNELARLQQETALLASALDLKRSLNLPLETELVLKDSSLNTMVPAGGYSATQLEAILSRRPDYQRLQTEIGRESLAVSAARRERLPSVELSGQWGYASESWSDDMEEEWSIQLGASMPVFEGLRLGAQKRLALSALRQRQLELDDLRAAIEASYRLVVQQLESSVRQVEVATRSRDLSQREYELERIRFEQGVADNSDVVDAQTTLAASEYAVVEAEFQLIAARISQARLEGDVMQLAR